MARFGMAVGLGAALLLVAGSADAQWRYTDDKGASKVTQYKIDVPSQHRETAEWIGPVGIGKPGLSAEQIRAAQHAEALRRIGVAEAGLLHYKPVAAPPPVRDPSKPDRPMAAMCIAGELRVMTSPGSWKVAGACAGGFSSGYGQDGYGSFGGMLLR